MLSSIPPIFIAGATLSKLMTTLSTRMQAKYGDAGNVVEQTLGAIRTVSTARHLFIVIIAGSVNSKVLMFFQPGLSSYSLKVVSFGGEKQAITTYNKFITKAYESSLQEGSLNGLGLGSVLAVLFCSYGLAVWYGSRLIVERGYNGGMIISIIMAVMMGAM